MCKNEKLFAKTGKAFDKKLLNHRQKRKKPYFNELKQGFLVYRRCCGSTYLRSYQT